MARGVDWAGYSFVPLGHHDGRFIRAPGVFAFVRRGPSEERALLFVDHADYVAAWAGPGHPVWGEALALGLNELHVFLKAEKRIDRLLIRGHLIKRCCPLLNVLGEDRQSDWEQALAGSCGMSHNGPPIDRWPPAALRRMAETVGEMEDGEWSVYSLCQTCKLKMRVSLEAMVKVHGRRFSLWNLQLPCRRVGCGGRVIFEGRPPKGRLMRLEAPQTTGPVPHARQGPPWL